MNKNAHQSIGGAMPSTYRRAVVDTLVSRAGEPRRFIQVLLGPRQTGKTTALKQMVASLSLPVHYASADDVIQPARDWLRAQWEQARRRLESGTPSLLLVIDEIQNIPQWSQVVKALWDEDSWADRDMRLIISGSSSLLLQTGLAESLMGRFELIHNTHWSLGECEEAFGYTLDDFLFHGGYPGAAALRPAPERWFDYMHNGVIEPALSRDVVALENVRKPALMRSLLLLGLLYSGQEVSYRKLLGQLDDAGNATTIAHYLSLLGNAGLLVGLQKYDDKPLKVRASSPRLMAFDTGLITAVNRSQGKRMLKESSLRGHLIESAVGASLLARSRTEHFEVYWWRDGTDEVDFVIRRDSDVVALEVKSGRTKSRRGTTRFLLEFPGSRVMTIGSAEAPIPRFLRGDQPLFER
jgi:predicted AAA+ superfamily ATPase